jgi:signal peptidase I
MKNFLKEWWTTILISALIFLSWVFIWVNVRVDGHSMDPTLAHGDRLFVLKVTPIDRFDIVVAKETADDGTKKKIVKRVIGMPGDVITYKDDVLTINGETVDEPYLADYLAKFQTDKLQETYSYNAFFQDLAKASDAFTTDSEGKTSFSITVPENHYFLLGDDRIVSSDSRHVGTFSKDAIIGEVIFRFYPFNTMGSLE